jgi:hypothetical protein
LRTSQQHSILQKGLAKAQTKAEVFSFSFLLSCLYLLWVWRETFEERTWQLKKNGGDVLERKTKILMISTVLVVAILSGIAAFAYANRINGDAGPIANVAGDGDAYLGGGHGHGGRPGYRIGPWGSITISQEFKDNVINIAKNDTDVQNLLNDGYNITAVRPIINPTVEANGTVTMKATNAIIILEKNTTSRATIWVNLDEGKVTRIVILTMTVIEKP